MYCVRFKAPFSYAKINKLNCRPGGGGHFPSKVIGMLIVFF